MLRSNLCDYSDTYTPPCKFPSLPSFSLPKGWWRSFEDKYENVHYSTPFREEEGRRDNWTTR